METSDEVRERESCSESRSETPSTNFPQQKIEIVPYLGLIYWTILCIFLLGLSVLVHDWSDSCRVKGDSSSSNRTNAQYEYFSEANARSHLKLVCELGPRPVGSEANEIHTPHYLKETFHRLKRLAHSELDSLPSKETHHPYQVDIDEQVASDGRFMLNQAFTSVYRNIRNLILRIHDTRSGVESKRHAILINCHYDTVIDSPGASDDFASCAIMLEVARALIIRKTLLSYDLIFLFNGAEENILQASHAFITQHPWRSHVSTFINMEAAGSGGRYFLFQVGPHAPWLVKEYASSVSSPQATILAMEIFQSGVIPSDTDFRIFRDYGRIPGVDLAFIKNGFVYHTKYDEQQRISSPCLQLAGSNLLAFIERLSQSPYVKNPSAYTGKDIIFFDVLGLFIITYSSFTAHIINVVLIIIFITDICWNYIRLSGWMFIMSLMKVLLNQMVCLLFVGLTLVFVALLMTMNGQYLTWYAQPHNIIGLYGFPFLWTFFTYHNISKKYFPWSTYQISRLDTLHHLAAQMILCILIIILTYMKVYSSYVFTIWLLFSILGRFLWEVLKPWRGESVWILEIIFTLHRLTIYIIPFIYQLNRTWLIQEVFVPILGRVGSKVNPELFLVAIIMFTMFLFPLFLAADVYKSNSAVLKIVRYFLLHLGLSYIACVLFTDMGFPYSSSVTTLRKQRISFVHINRVFHGVTHEGGLVEGYDSGIWIQPYDINGVRFLEAELPPDYLPIQRVKCNDRPYCGLPHLYPHLHVLQQSFFIPKEPHGASPSSHLSVLSLVALSSHLINVTLAVDGPSCNHIFIQTYEARGIALRRWSFIPGRPAPVYTPTSSFSETYFVYNSYGSAPTVSSLRFWIVVEVAADLNEKNSLANQPLLLQVALSAHYRFGIHKTTKVIEQFIQMLPDWVVPTVWTANYESWKIDLRRGLSFIQ